MNLEWKELAIRLQNHPFYAKQLKVVFGDKVIDSVLISKAIAQFERTLLSYRSRYDRVVAGKEQFTQNEYEGFEIMNDMTKGDCLHCHTTDNDALGVNPSFSNNGLDTGNLNTSFKDRGYGAITGHGYDNGKFKVPSLRNIAITAPYMHDGRFKCLEEVLNFYSYGLKRNATIDSKMEFVHQGGVRLSPEDQRKVIAFLNTLTDSAFIQDPAFSNPFR